MILCLFLFPSSGKGTADLDGRTGILNARHRPEVSLQETGLQPFKNDTHVSDRSKEYIPGSVHEMSESLRQKDAQPGRIYEPVLLFFLGFGLIIIAGFGRRKPPSG